jgi:hypothetical protein
MSKLDIATTTPTRKADMPFEKQNEKDRAADRRRAIQAVLQFAAHDGRGIASTINEAVAHDRGAQFTYMLLENLRDAYQLDGTESAERKAHLQAVITECIRIENTEETTP